MKKTALFLALCLALCLMLPASAEEPAPESEGFRYRLLEDGTAEILKYTGSELRLVIPEALDGRPVTAIGSSAFIFCASLEEVRIPEGVTAIGEAAFEACFSLTTVEIPDSVTEIGENAFYSCADELVIICGPDSCAQTYCEENNIAFRTE